MTENTYTVSEDPDNIITHLAGLNGVEWCQKLSPNLVLLYVTNSISARQACVELGGQLLPMSNSADQPNQHIFGFLGGLTALLIDAAHRPTDTSHSHQSYIEIIGANVNNLQNIQIKIPHNKVTAITGVSGSGKTSLAYDTIYAEGQRRFRESISTSGYALGPSMSQPKVDFIHGLSPVVPISQKTNTNNPRSTVGTLTGIHNYLRALFSAIGIPLCPLTQEEVSTRSPRQLLYLLDTLSPGTAIDIGAPIARNNSDNIQQILRAFRSEGYSHVLLGKKLLAIDNRAEIAEGDDHFEVVVGRIEVGKHAPHEILNTIAAGFRETGKGFLSLNINHSDSATVAFYQRLNGSSQNVIAEELDPSIFSFNTKSGACPSCLGLGYSLKPDPGLVVTNPKNSLRDGPFAKNAFGGTTSWKKALLHNLAKAYGFDLDIPYQKLPDSVKELFLYGTENCPAKNHHEDFRLGMSYPGILPEIERRYQRYLVSSNLDEGRKNPFKALMAEMPCSVCLGHRLSRQRQQIKILNNDIGNLGDLPLTRLKEFFSRVSTNIHLLESHQQLIHAMVTRLDQLIGLGLDYLTLNRPSPSLSGGESQRIRLSTQIGSGLANMVYILDEPSVGLHPKDKIKMIETTKHLCDIGNTIIMVEHDEQIIRSADYVIEMGPGPGKNGGKVVASGTVDALLACGDSPTAQYLSGQKSVDTPKVRRIPKGRFINIKGARANNLKNINVSLPLGILTCVTGASGSGKSTLVHDILYKKLHSLYRNAPTKPGEHSAVTGHEYVDDISCIDQSPIGKSARSNPVTYTGLSGNIRRLFAATKASSALKLSVSHFSFNTPSGRCEECLGEGVKNTELPLLPSAEVICPSCGGLRFNQKVLQILFNGKTIADVLALTIEEGIQFFSFDKAICNKLSFLEKLGLGYLSLGQPASKLSGGEAQRIKLANELSKKKRGRHTLYILDEPTTGLHLADIEHLLNALNSLVDNNNTVVIIEHHLDVIKTADYVIDLGPEGGPNGGRVIATGTPEEIAAIPESHTGKYLKPYL